MKITDVPGEIQMAFFKTQQRHGVHGGGLNEIFCIFFSPCPPCLGKFRGRTGLGGMIVVVLVLGFMMAISTSYVLMIQTESLGGKVGATYFRARAAALAGVEFIRAQLAATTTTFGGDPRLRMYWARTNNSADIIPRMATTTLPAAFTAVVGTQWYFPNFSSTLLDGEWASSTAFRVTSYPDDNNIATAYYVKSIGTYFDINQANSSVLSSWSCQIVARLNISQTSQDVKLDSWRPMTLEPCSLTADIFFASQTKFSP